MLFNSIDFLLFFPLVTVVYFLLPHRVRWVWLLVTSYFFYMCWNPKYVVLIALSTVVTWLSGLLIGRAGRVPDPRRRALLRRLWVALSFVINLAVLFFFKYFGFFWENLAALAGLAGITLRQPGFDLLLPVGISFYSFQALGYTVDVYRGELPPERNLFRYALFVSFFPQLVAGPIERSRNLLTQLYGRHDFDPDRVRDGLLLMLWGMFEKVVVADRIAYLVTHVFDRYQELPGVASVLAVLLFGVQLYCDFAGYSDIARGAAEVLGFRLMVNFRQPYFARSTQDFWRRWHISLSSWFRDYLYIPLGGSRKGTARKYWNLLAVQLTSGLWHGANWTYVVTRSRGRRSRPGASGYAARCISGGKAPRYACSVRYLYSCCMIFRCCFSVPLACARRFQWENGCCSIWNPSRCAGTRCTPSALPSRSFTYCCGRWRRC